VQQANDLWKTLQEKGGPPPDIHSAEHQQYMQTFVQRLAQTQRTHRELFIAKRPPEIWSGSPALQKRLDELWAHYEPISQERFAWEKKLQPHDNGAANLWQDLHPYHTRLDSLIIHFVPYCYECDYPVPPRSVVMTIVDGHFDDKDVRDRALRAAEALATNLSS
jgi:hypothetical protein